MEQLEVEITLSSRLLAIPTPPILVQSVDHANCRAGPQSRTRSLIWKLGKYTRDPVFYIFTRAVQNNAFRSGDRTQHSKSWMEVGHQGGFQRQKRGPPDSQRSTWQQRTAAHNKRPRKTPRQPQTVSWLPFPSRLLSPAVPPEGGGLGPEVCKST